MQNTQRKSIYVDGMTNVKCPVNAGKNWSNIQFSVWFSWDTPWYDCLTWIEGANQRRTAIYNDNVHWNELLKNQWFSELAALLALGYTSWCEWIPGQRQLLCYLVRVGSMVWSPLGQIQCHPNWDCHTMKLRCCHSQPYIHLEVIIYNISTSLYNPVYCNTI